MLAFVRERASEWLEPRLLPRTSSTRLPARDRNPCRSRIRGKPAATRRPLVSVAGSRADVRGKRGRRSTFSIAFQPATWRRPSTDGAAAVRLGRAPGVRQILSGQLAPAPRLKCCECYAGTPDVSPCVRRASSTDRAPLRRLPPRLEPVELQLGHDPPHHHAAVRRRSREPIDARER